MFKRILVPLDGSGLAEAVLPAVIYLAERFSATIILFHAIERSARTTIHGQRHLSTPDEASAYLSEIVKRLQSSKLNVETDLHSTGEPDVARSIITHVSELKADLIALCAHGHTGWRELIVGNIAQQVVQLGTTPVFFVRPGETKIATSFECHRILVPLDGAPVHEPALPVAMRFAKATGSAIHLINVVPTPGTLSAEQAGARLFLPTTMAAVLEMAQRGAGEYLQERLDELAKQGIQATAEVVRGDVAPSILNVMQRSNADLICMATHGRANIDAFWSGSVTPKILAQAGAPVLLIRVTGEEPIR
ncbi:universal stress protein [Candidatus Acetothermia bacterium]|nr:universal stress protein [Candidatus Acetothermia bacterium]